MKKLGKLLLRTFGKITLDKGPIAKILRHHWDRLVLKGLDKKSNIHKGAIITGTGEKLVIKAHSGIGIRCQVGSNLYIGEHTMMGPDCIILTQNHKFDKDCHAFEGMETKSFSIGDNCWIGISTIILPGARIDNNCIIGAGSGVPGKKYPDNVLIAGKPAIIKKYLVKLKKRLLNHESYCSFV